MKTILHALLIFCVILAGPAALFAQDGTSEGEKLERQMWSDFKAKDWPAVDAKIAAGFQSVHRDGPHDRAGEIALIKGLTLGDYTLTDFKVTPNGDDLVVTYWVSVPETIDGKRLSSKPAMRMSVWEHGPTGWQWIAHANLKAW